MSKNEELQLIPLSEKYIEYILKIIFKIPRVEKYSIGTEYKKSMYEMLREIMYINKLENDLRLEMLNKIDAELNTQRIFLRIMYKSRFIDEKKLNVAMGMIYEIGKVLGGIIKYYGTNNKK